MVIGLFYLDKSCSFSGHMKYPVNRGPTNLPYLILLPKNLLSWYYYSLSGMHGFEGDNSRILSLFIYSIVIHQQ